MAAATRWRGGDQAGGRLYDFDRRWLLNQIVADHRSYQMSVERGEPALALIGRIDARLLVGLQFALLSHEEEARLRRQYLSAWEAGR